jgi:hypothetical protein
MKLRLLRYRQGHRNLSLRPPAEDACLCDAGSGIMRDPRRNLAADF